MSESGRNRYRALVVDDERHTVEIINEVLSESGFHCTSAPTARQALAQG